VRPESYALPKPKGYFEIALPDTASAWMAAKDGVEAGFRLNRRAQWTVVDAQKGWVTLRYPSLGAEIQLSYVPVKGQLNQLLDDSYQLAFKHDVVAQGIQEKQYADPSRRVYGLLYQFKGNTATPCQFFVTDSTRHFLRGSVYVMAKPNADSLAPVNAFLREEVIRLMETTRWP
jgi:gliding motility-associated lipoprotein GldD